MSHRTPEIGRTKLHLFKFFCPLYTHIIKKFTTRDTAANVPGCERKRKMIRLQLKFVPVVDKRPRSMSKLIQAVLLTQVSASERNEMQNNNNHSRSG